MEPKLGLSNSVEFARVKSIQFDRSQESAFVFKDGPPIATSPRAPSRKVPAQRRLARSPAAGRPAALDAARDRGRGFGFFVALRGGRSSSGCRSRAADDLLVLFLPQQLAHALGLAHRRLHVLVGGSLDEEHHALARGALPRMSVADASRLVPELRFAARAAHLDAVVDRHGMSSEAAMVGPGRLTGG